MNYLEKIIARKQIEINSLLQSPDLNERLEKFNTETNSFSSALKSEDFAIIAEIKRKSPSRGEIGKIKRPEELALKYCLGGASAISVLTDYVGFGGTLSDLDSVSQMLRNHYPNVVTLRKDFIVHPIQLAETVCHGATCVLLIAKVLGDELASYIQIAKKLGLETLTEVHDLDDLKLALDSGATIIGINNRNLKTFETDLSHSEKLKAYIPSNVITVAESGIHTISDAQKMKQLGFNAILVGEALVSSQNPVELIRQMKGQFYES